MYKEGESFSKEYKVDAKIVFKPSSKNTGTLGSADFPGWQAFF